MSLLAHVGSGLDAVWSGVLHPLTGVDHLLAMVAVGVLAALVVDRRIAWATPAAFVVGMAAGGVLGIAGVGSGLVETSIALSIVVLGAMIAATIAPFIRLGGWAPAVGLAFGGMHGLAHGGEVPASASPAVYVLGFLSATVALHVAGVVVGTALGERSALRAGVAALVTAAGVAVLAGAPI